MNLRFELFVNDVERSVDFYKNILGFEERHKSTDFASVKNGNVQIGIGRMKKLYDTHPLRVRSNDERRGLGVEVVFVVENVEEVYQQVLAAGYPIAAQLSPQPWGLTDFRLIDPDGYYLRITN